MSPLIIFIIALVSIFLLLFFYGISIYNKLITLRNRFKNAYAQIDVQLKRRNDLIPNLVETAKGYMKHERETLEAVVNARNGAVSAGLKAVTNPENPEVMKNLNTAETTLNGAMGRFFALMENYPDLKANQNMSALQEELTSTENKIAFSRQAFNDAVTFYNTARETFPEVIIANNTGFKPAELFVIQDEKEKETPKISF